MFGKLWSLITKKSRTLTVLEKGKFTKIGIWKKFGFLFGKILKYPEIDMTLCCIKHLVYYVCSCYFL